MTAPITRRTDVLLCAALVALLTAAAQASGLSYTTPDGWQASHPRSTMRVAEFTLPRAAGDAEDAQLIVYYFGGEGGSVEANMDRWVGQVQQSDGKPSKSVARREQRTVNGLKLTLLDVSGRYVADSMPGGGQPVNKPDFRMRAGVVQTPNGPYFFKLTGPQKTVGKWDQAFEKFVSSLKYEP